MITMTKEQSYNSTSSKELHEMTINELGQLFPIVIQNYTDKWIELFEAEKQLITDNFAKSEIISIDHIGSTAIPGLKAKPTIDILFQVSEQIDIPKMKNIFKSFNYHINEPLDNPPPHLTFVKGYTKEGYKGQSFHVHIRYKDDWDEIRFRDYLINHEDIAKEYEILKIKLADRYRKNREAYTDSKTDFIEKINKLTRK